MYNKLEEQEYASMGQKYRSEYVGRNLRGFCLEHKVSYQKMLHCLRRESYRNTQQAEEVADQEKGLHPLEVELPANAPVTETQTWNPARNRLRNCNKSQLHRDPTNGDIFIFLSWDSHRVRLYYFYPQGEMLTEKILRGNQFVEPVFDEKKGCYRISWESFVYLVEGIILKDRRVQSIEDGG